MTVDAVAGLRANHDDLRIALAGVSDDDWSRPSACAGWRVQDVLAHVTSNFKEMVDPSPAPAPAPAPSGEAVPPPAMKAEEAMEALVAPRKTWSPAELLAEYLRYGDAALEILAGMQDEPAASTLVPLADLGTYPVHQLANAYCFDHYCHLRHDLLAPKGPLTISLPAVDDARLRPGIDWMWSGLPQMCRDALKVVTEPITFVLTGPGGGTWTVRPAGDDGLVTIVEGATDATATGPAAATVTSSAHDFVSWGTRRSDWRDACALDGDTAYAAAVLDAIDII